MTQYIISPEAALDLDEISTYYAIHNIEAGEKLLDEFEAKCKYLVNSPNIGRSYKSLRADLRGLSFSAYIIFYRVGNNIVENLRVVSGSRDLEALFADPDRGL
ncbi:type II toxin-antitoxin system RelE/ParE family toxin [Chamaesiphon sp. VAR_69_metabat_338]|uniref:type II toxin-antitoxin system RelE/ParE family toxin n=1 Tax=Chamaesiphon sp. VAR_69_metabat_338 TaxID=2964704 RepID=UPI00286EB1EA|nr:type II toxin-antitoxin system RelE/ParE family toxin [Chamaesiphon sp. VAR_69_metabat_338]